jgi:hypothetical protein
MSTHITENLIILQIRFSSSQCYINIYIYVKEEKSWVIVWDVELFLL